MRQLVQQHLSSRACVTLLGTCCQLARTVVQHCTHDAEQQKQTLRWAWRAPGNDGSVPSTATPQFATAARLLAEWAPAELHVCLDVGMPPKGGAADCTTVSLPAALRPLITSLEVDWAHLTRASVDELQQCRRLHTLELAGCTFERDVSDEGVGELPLDALEEALRGMLFGYAVLPPRTLPKQPAKPLQPLPLLRTFR